MYRRMREQIQNELESCINNIDVTLIIDGVDLGLEESEIKRDISYDGGQIKIDLILGLKRMIQRHPGEYNENLHWSLFTDEERINLSLSMR